MVCGDDETFSLGLLWLRHLDNKLSRLPDIEGFDLLYYCLFISRLNLAISSSAVCRLV